MDLEANQAMLTPLMCEACILRRKKKNSRRIIARCCFVAYNILVLLVLSVTLWYINDRLHDTEKNVAVLQEQSKMQNEKHPSDTSSLAMTIDAEEKQAQNDQIVNLVETVGGEVDSAIRTKRGTKQKRKSKKRCKDDQRRNRHSRTASSSTPHFYLTGSERGDDNGVFMWKRPNRSFDRSRDFFHADINSNYNSLTKVTILRSGVYFVFGKVTANGRNTYDSSMVPSVGLYLMKNVDEVLDVARTTQDERGRLYGAIRRRLDGASEEFAYPMDTMSVFGLYKLNVNDKIYLQRPPDRLTNTNDRYLSEGSKAHFGAFLVEPECVGC